MPGDGSYVYGVSIYCVGCPKLRCLFGVSICEENNIGPDPNGKPKRMSTTMLDVDYEGWPSPLEVEVECVIRAGLREGVRLCGSR